MLFSDIVVESFTHTVILQGITENAYVLHRWDRRDCLIIDPGIGPHCLINYIKRENLNPVAILVTHGHYDHIGGIPDVQEEWPDVKVIIGELDSHKLNDPKCNLSRSFGYPIAVPQADIIVADKQMLNIAGMGAQAIWVPGHSRGHMIYLVPSEDRILAFVGDVIFAGSIGATEFGDGDFNQLVQGIELSILPLPEQTVILPGHGKLTTVLNEKQTNPWLRFSFINRGVEKGEYVGRRRKHRQKSSLQPAGSGE